MNASYLGQFLAFVALGSIIDQLLGEKARVSAARYAFGWVKGGFSEFESSFITGLISWFCSRSDIEKISKVRVFFLSLFVSTFYFIFLFLFNGTGVLGPEDMLWTASHPLWIVLIVSSIACVLLALISFPFDFYSIYVSKKLFYYKFYNPSDLPKKIIDDAVDSSAPVFALFGAIGVIIFLYSTISGSSVSFSQFAYSYLLGMGSLWLYFVPNLIATVSLTIIQICGLLAAIFLRGVFSIKVFRRFEESSRLKKNPFLYMFLILGVIASLIDLASYFWRF
ncbi:hypothetical protein AAG612_01480 [Citromicrobium bathyomarinum]|uniref:hypothetical protein n=1 Tax=Citromicrobium bathyomarinum TaxID=72174 RepID=UPI00315A81D6